MHTLALYGSVSTVVLFLGTSYGEVRAVSITGRHATVKTFTSQLRRLETTQRGTIRMPADRQGNRGVSTQWSVTQQGKAKPSNNKNPR